LDLRSDELRKGGVRLKVPDQSIRVLKALLEQPGEVVTREQLCERLWPPDTCVDVEHGINAAVRRLRAALRDDADRPRYIETVPRRGYRFVGSVAPARQPTPDGSPEPAPEPAPAPAVAPGPAPPAGAPPQIDAPAGDTARRRWAIVVGAVTLLAALLLVIASRTRRVADTLEERPLTTFDGHESAGRFSPDGHHVVFAWARRGERADLYIKRLGSDAVHPMVVTPDADEAGPVFSPDGRLIAFVRVAPDVSTLVVKPREGGAERRVADVTTPHPAFLASPGPHLAWTPDGSGLVYSYQRALWLHRLDGSSAVQLTSPPSTAARGDADPALSPDGRTLAFARVGSTGASDIYLLRLDARSEPTGPAVLRHADGRWNRSPAWHPDGERLVFVSGHWGRYRLQWLTRAGTDGPQPVAGISADAHQPAVSPTTGEVLYTRWQLSRDLFALPLAGPGRASGPPQPLVPSSRASNMARLSRDGTQIVFQSDRTGSFEVWIAGTDGRGLRRVTSFDGPPAGCPDLSPDGTRIAFDHLHEGQRDVFVSDTFGAGLQRLTDHPADDLCPRWSADGSALHFASLRDGTRQVWTLHLDTGVVVRTTSEGGMTADPSPDGAALYVTQHDGVSPPVFALPKVGGPPLLVVDAIRGQQMAASGEGLYYVPPDAAHDIWFHDTRTGTRRRVATIPGGVSGPLAVDPNHRLLVSDTPGTAGGDLILASAARPQPRARVAPATGHGR
jgi:Tol biopolymer transport system component/DNA-binding winged helix-turn-helix (wHTH) protein